MALSPHMGWWYLRKIDEKKQRPLELLARYPKLPEVLRRAASTKEVEGAIGLKLRWTLEVLKELERGGIITRHRGKRGTVWELTRDRGEPIANLLMKMRNTLEDPVKAVEGEVSECLELLESERDTTREIGFALLSKLASEANIGVTKDSRVLKLFINAMDDHSYEKLSMPMLSCFRDVFFKTDILGKPYIKRPFPERQTQIKIIEKMKEYCLRRPSKAWIFAMEIVAYLDEGNAVDLICRVIKKLPNKLWDPRDVGIIAGRLSPSSKDKLKNRISNLATRHLNRKVRRRANSVLNVCSKTGVWPNT